MCADVCNYKRITQISVTGCPDVEAPEYAWYKRNGDIAEIGCEWNHNTWKLKCENNVWVGVVGNCSGPGQVENRG